MALNKEIDICEKISSEVRNTFLQIYNALKHRETQLLRQIEVLSQHYKLNESYDKCFKQVTIIFDTEGDMLSSIANFGRIDFNGLSSDSDVYKVEDYQRPERDHVSLYKYIESSCPELLNKSNNIKIELGSVDESVLNKTEEIENKNEEKMINNTPDSQSNDDINTLFNRDNQSVVTDTNFCECVNQSNDINTSDSQSNITDTNLYESVNHSNDFDRNFFERDSQDDTETNLTDRVRRLSMKQDDQVQQWMKQIQSEPELEPASSHVMEHSNITPPYINTV